MMTRVRAPEATIDENGIRFSWKVKWGSIIFGALLLLVAGTPTVKDVLTTLKFITPQPVGVEITWPQVEQTVKTTVEDELRPVRNLVMDHVTQPMHPGSEGRLQQLSDDIADVNLSQEQLQQQQDMFVEQQEKFTEITKDLSKETNSNTAALNELVGQLKQVNETIRIAIRDNRRVPPTEVP